MEINYATGNAGKIASLRRTLAPLGHTVRQYQMEIPELQASVEEIARHKARTAALGLGRPVVAHDAGFFLDAWPDFPGPYVGPVFKSLGFEGFLKLLEGRERGCEFHECLVYWDPEDIGPKTFNVVIRGTLSTRAADAGHAEAWSHLWRIFIPTGCDRTVGEMTEAQRHAWRTSPAYRSTSTEFVRWLERIHPVRAA